MINIEDFDSNLLKIGKKPFKNIDIYYIDDYKNIHSENPLYLIISKVIGHIEEKNWSKYLVFDPTDKKIEVLTKYTKLWDGIKNKIVTINGGKTGAYGKDFTKIKFSSDDSLPLNKTLKIHNATIIVRSVFQ